MSITPRSIALILVGALFFVVGILVWRWPVDPPPEPAWVQSRLVAARQFQQDAKWCDAKAVWVELLDRTRAGDPYAVERSEAEESRKICEQNCKPPRKPTGQWKRPGTSDEPLPEKVSQDELVEYYPVGKTVHSMSFLNMTGEGTNANWILKGTTHFAYQYRVAVETKVKNNSGTAVVFEQHFKEVMQTRAECHDELELNPPDSPILTVVWSELDRNVLSNVPAYRIAKKLAEIANGADPNLKWTLTHLSKWLRRAGQVPAQDDPLPVAIKVEQLQGTRFEIEYISGLGVTYVKVLDDKQLDPDLLERLAHRSSLLMDYVIGKEANADDGKPFGVPFKEVRGLSGLENDIDGDGELILQKDQLAEPANDGPIRLSITGGNISIRAAVRGAQRTGTIRPIGNSTSGQDYVLYSKKSHSVQRAMVAWEADFDWFTEDSLLFGTRSLRHVKMTSYYEAEVLPGKQ